MANVEPNMPLKLNLDPDQNKNLKATFSTNSGYLTSLKRKNETQDNQQAKKVRFGASQKKTSHVVVHEKTNCFNCNMLGHLTEKCPEPKSETTKKREAKYL